MRQTFFTINFIYRWCTLETYVDDLLEHSFRYFINLVQQCSHLTFGQVLVLITLFHTDVLKRELLHTDRWLLGDGAAGHTAPSQLGGMVLTDGSDLANMLSQ